MNTVLIARFKNKKDASSAARLMKQFKSDVGLLDEASWEDIELAKLIDAGMKEPGQVPLKTILEKLKK